jgi:hypothetical protein
VLSRGLLMHRPGQWRLVLAGGGVKHFKFLLLDWWP